MELTNENYYSLEANQEYMSASQLKDFMVCPAMALAKIKGEWVEEKTDALLIGSYVDSYFANELEQFKQDHPEIFNSRTGELKSQYLKADEIIRVINEDEMMKKSLGGKHQVIYTGTIAGVPFKGKFDSDFDDSIVDGKVMKDLEPVWVKNEEGRNVQQNFVNAYGYDLQGGIYRELKRQRMGVNVPFVLSVVTKEKVPSKALLEIDSEDLDKALKTVEELAPHFQDIKLGKVPPTYCGKCDYCKSIRKVDHIISFHELDPYGN